MSALVSILIPGYNAAPWLRETLESAFAQTWPDKEIIFVDDGSKDDSVAIARTFEPRGLKVITQPNAGAATARNTAWKASRGAWLQFLDADDLLAPDKIERQMRAVRGEEFIYGGAWGRFTGSVATTEFRDEPLNHDAIPVDWIVQKLETHGMMHPAAWLTPRALAERAGYWDQTLTLDDDGEFFSRVVLTSQGVRYCGEARSYYRSNLAGSLSRSKSDRAWASAHRSLALTNQRLLALEDSPRTRRAAATVLQRFIYESYPQAAGPRREAVREIARLGGSDLRPEYGPKFKLVARFLGWKAAKRLLERS